MSDIFVGIDNFSFRRNRSDFNQFGGRKWKDLEKLSIVNGLKNDFEAFRSSKSARPKNDYGKEIFLKKAELTILYEYLVKVSISHSSAIVASVFRSPCI